MGASMFAYGRKADVIMFARTIMASGGAFSGNPSACYRTRGNISTMGAL
jgi:hypothetical protein